MKEGNRDDDPREEDVERSLNQKKRGGGGAINTDFAEENDRAQLHDAQSLGSDRDHAHQRDDIGDLKHSQETRLDTEGMKERHIHDRIKDHFSGDYGQDIDPNPSSSSVNAVPNRVGKIPDPLELAS